MLEIKDEGICRFCLKTFAGRSIGRHLVACEAKKQQDTQNTTKGRKSHSIFHLKIWGYKPFWLHVEARSDIQLADLDRFLRGIWLECCGHLSEFTIDGVGYSGSDMGSDVWGLETESMNAPLKQVLGVKDKFEHEYDFGSTTRLQGQVFAERSGAVEEGIQILARNTAPQWPCDMCGAQATEIDVEYDKLYCEKCLVAELGDEHEMTLPVVNSPRMGVCGYTGGREFDNFDPELISAS